ncbi:MAG: prepilin-type N-terminal cleavage/methylation domain-containing protein [Roseburia sp.]|nr:prepilin-type N-terminal cleavage/methylation domain-containing protein [Roseburia sp.]
MKKLNDKGLSLVELIIVLSIMAVVVSIATLSIRGAMTKPAEECAEKIVNGLKAARITTMGKESCVLVLKQASDKDTVYLEQRITNAAGDTTNKLSTVGKKGVSVKLHIKGDGATSYTNLYDFAPGGVELRFRRDTGGFYPIPGTSFYYDEIVVEKGDRVCKIKLANLTGNVSIE